MAISLPAGIPRGNPKLLDQVRDVIRRKHYSIRTELYGLDSAVHPFPWQTAPVANGGEEVSAFLTHLARDELAASTHSTRARAERGEVTSILLAAVAAFVQGL
jgi:hypothetical protein